ncbi:MULTISPECIES: flavin reductase family protein [unclassified Bacillus (in: firmicutes)]|uniref:flavin reductase family protein n=1 Tax=unclassified Bacillus (in: firmicutes) TaxID=185979 RepID=UPI001BE90951|nr:MULTISPECIES: flavin reductase family protein [unclassified Bacillus (in: firmicutes)]MBT2723748.1 flavin reductase [Bacillus sp. ISL-46]MBT2740788.1 flavin reductase [Bacillus sp. ISL-77]
MDDRLFRDAMGKFATGVTVLLTENEGETHGMTANGFMSVSLDPKLVLISIGHKAKFLEKVSQSKKYTVNILAEDQEHYSRHFAGKPGEEVEFETLAELPVLKGAIAQIACEVVSEHIEGDHTLFIGKVVDLRLLDKDPLLFFSGKYRQLTVLETVKS